MKKLICLFLALPLFMPLSVEGQPFDLKQAIILTNTVCRTLTEANNVKPIEVIILNNNFPLVRYIAEADKIGVSKGMVMFLDKDAGALSYVIANVLVHVRPANIESPIAKELLKDEFAFKPWVVEEIYDTALAIDYMIRAGVDKKYALVNEKIQAYNPSYVGLRKFIFVKNYIKLLP